MDALFSSLKSKEKVKEHINVILKRRNVAQSGTILLHFNVFHHLEPFGLR